MPETSLLTKIPLTKVVLFMQEEGLSYREALDVFNKVWLEEALLRNGNNQSRVAEQEHMHRNTLSRLMKTVGARKRIVQRVDRRYRQIWNDEALRSDLNS